jgi:hypothetical protein
MTDDEPLVLVCTCGHTDEEHDPDMGFCLKCGCVVFRTEDELKEELDGEELDFDHGQ